MNITPLRTRQLRKISLEKVIECERDSVVLQTNCGLVRGRGGGHLFEGDDERSEVKHINFFHETMFKQSNRNWEKYSKTTDV